VIDGFSVGFDGAWAGARVTDGVSAAVVLVVLVGGLLFFQRVEGTVADRVLSKIEALGMLTAV